VISLTLRHPALLVLIGQEGQIERSGSTHVLIEALSVAVAAVSYVSTNLTISSFSAYGANPAHGPLRQTDFRLRLFRGAARQSRIGARHR
jgi:hypothetical protein